MKGKIEVLVTEELVREVSGVEGPMSPEWFQQVTAKIAELLRNEDLTYYTRNAVDDVGSNEDYAKVNERRMIAFVEWVRRRIIRTNGYVLADGAHAEAYVSGMMDGQVRIEVEHGENILDSVCATIYIDAAMLNDEEVPFEQIYRSMI
jgi:hypothetical protein